MAGGQVSTSGQGSVTPSESAPLVGSAITGATGFVSAYNADLTGSASASGIGTIPPGAVVALRSRKVGGGSASRDLSGIGLTQSAGIAFPESLRSITTQLTTSAQGSFGKNRSRLLTGSSVSSAMGVVSDTPQTDVFWSGTVPTVQFTQGTPGVFSVLPYLVNFQSTQQDIQLLSGTLPSGVTIDPNNGYVYNGSGAAAVQNVSLTIVDTGNASKALTGSAVNVSAGTVSVAGTSADADFALRSSSPGVFRVFSFNSSSDLGGSFGANFGTVPGTGSVGLDSSVKASGSSSLRFDLLAGGHANGGGNSSSWFTNFHPTLQRYGANTSFFYQFKVRISQTAFEDYTHKFFLCGSGDDGTNVFSSCTDLEIEMEHYGNANGVSSVNRFPIMYNACPGSCGGVWAFYETLSGGNFDLQPNGVPPVCSYQDATKAGCVQFVPEQWMVFQVGVNVGPRITSGGHFWFQGSRVRCWMQTSPGATEQLIIDWTTGTTSGSQIGLCAGNGATGNQAYGKLWLLPYTQNSIGTSARAGNVWYDELILSEQKIPAAQA